MSPGFRLFCTVLTCLLCSLSTVEAATAAERSVIIGFRQPPGAAEQALITGKKGRINRKYRHLPAVTAVLPEAEIEALRRNPNVAYVAENSVLAVTPTLPGTESGNSWNVEQIGARAAHDAGFLGEGVKVAVIDSGIDTTHPELVDAYAGGIDIIGNDPDPSVDPTGSSHGTHVAGIIAGARNSTGVVGVAPGVALYAVKISNGADLTIANLVAGIDWAIDNSMQIINLSLGDPLENLAVTDAVTRADAAGILVVAAAGNSIGPVVYPAATPSVIAVTPTDINKQIANFAPNGPQIDLAAPGINITSTVVGGYDTLTGSSMAAPQVAGVAALLLASPGLIDENGNGRRLDELKARLFASAEDLGAPCKDEVFGYGLVNAARALGLESIPTPNVCTDPPPVTDPGIAVVADISLARQSRHSEDDAKQATLSGGKYAITIINNGLKAISVMVYKNDVFVEDLSGKLTFNRKTAKGVTLPFDASAGSYRVVFLPSGKFGASATLLFNAPDSALPGAVKGINRKYKHLP